MTLIITFDLENDLGSTILFQKWILEVWIIWKSGITLLSRHISSKIAFSSVFDFAYYMLISYYANNKSSPRLPSWQPSLISFNAPIDSRSIIKPCTLKLFQFPILAPGLYIYVTKALKREKIYVSQSSPMLQYKSFLNSKWRHVTEILSALTTFSEGHRWIPLLKKTFSNEDSRQSSRKWACPRWLIKDWFITGTVASIT